MQTFRAMGLAGVATLLALAPAAAEPRLAVEATGPQDDGQECFLLIISPGSDPAVTMNTDCVPCVVVVDGKCVVRGVVKWVVALVPG